MSGITSGIGLISGIDTASLIEQLLAIEARPVRALQTRSQAIDARRTALMGISAKVLALQESASRFHQIGLFRQFSATSNNEAIATASASATATPGARTFRVHSLVANHSVLSRGFVSSSQTPVGVGRLVIEVGKGRVDTATTLGSLNGGTGVRRGIITITDRSGATAEIDLTHAYTINDVLDAINANPTARVRASVTSVAANGATGDRIVIEDLRAEPET